jgi:hypothetical protein
MRKSGIRRYIGPKRATALIVLVALFVLARYLQQQGLLTPEFLLGYLRDYPFTSEFLFTGIYAVSVVASVVYLSFCKFHSTVPAGR